MIAYTHVNLIAQQQVDINSLKAENARLRAALEEAREDILSFGNHDWDCKFILSNFSDACSCWHQKSINAIDEELKGQP